MKKQIKKDILTFSAVFLEEDGGGYSISVPALPGCFSQGDSFEGAVKNTREAFGFFCEDDCRNFVDEFRLWDILSDEAISQI